MFRTGRSDAARRTVLQTRRPGASKPVRESDWIRRPSGTLLPLMPDLQEDVTQLLQDWSHGNTEALDKLIPLVFEDLRRIAGRMFQRESDGHTLQPTALVNEVYFRLVDQRKVQWQNREQFFAVAALLMRRILVDYAKGRQAAKRGEQVPKVPLRSPPIPDIQNLDRWRPRRGALPAGGARPAPGPRSSSCGSSWA